MTDTFSAFFEKERVTVPLAVAVAAVVTLAAGCPSKPAAGPASLGWYSETRELYFRIPVSVRFTPVDDKLAARVWERLQRVDEIFNIYREDSELSRVNAAAWPGEIEVSAELAHALGMAGWVCEETDGAFDPTVWPLVELWRRAAKKGVPPEDDEVKMALGRVGMRGHSAIEANMLTLSAPGVSFDLGGIIKGIAVDDAISMLKEAGCTAALVQVGGETGAYGVSPKSRPHVIGVQDPLRPFDPTAVWTAVQDPGTGISAATSGNYQQPVVIGGEVFYHIVNPRTGYPVDTRTLSVTVVFPVTGKNGLADGLSTAAAVLGAEKAIPIVERLGGEAFFLVEDADEVREVRSAGWDALVYDPDRTEGR